MEACRWSRHTDQGTCGSGSAFTRVESITDSGSLVRSYGVAGEISGNDGLAGGKAASEKTSTATSEANAITACHQNQHFTRGVRSQGLVGSLLKRL